VKHKHKYKKLSAIRKVQAGQKVIDPELIMDAYDNHDLLTEKERQALKLAADDLSTQAIAEHMFLYAGTVRSVLVKSNRTLSYTNWAETESIQLATLTYLLYSFKQSTS
jgi:two-component system response regulator DesR